MVNFRGASPTTQRFSGQRRPPNYLSPRAQIRILSLFAALAVVIVLMRQARDPANWRWIWLLDRGTAEQQVDARREPARRSQDNEPAVTRRDESRDKMVQVAQPAANDSAENTAYRLERDGWSTILAQLLPSDRKLLRRVLFDARHGIQLPAPQQAACTALFETLLKSWQSYEQEFLATMDSESSPLTATQKQKCRTAITQCLAAAEDLRPVLQAAASPQKMTETDRRRLEQLQTLYDEIDWRRVQDNTPLWRSAEYDAWYRVWEQLDTPRADQSPAEAVRVSRLQLFSEPSVYRDRLVKFRGTVQAAYRAAATDNLLGITHYYVLTIHLRPMDPSDVRVYCTALPADFPPIRAGDGTHRPTLLNETVEITGYFFKRAVCLTTAGPQLTPVVLGSVSGWLRRPRDQDRSSGPDLQDLAIICAGAALFGVLVAYWVYRRTSRPSTRQRS